jgi:hypothetical protein
MVILDEDALTLADEDINEVLPGFQWVERVGFQPVSLTKSVLNPFALSLSKGLC